MKIGVCKEIKEQEYRVAIIPSNVGILTKKGHEVYVQHDAGKAAGFEDCEYERVGAKILPDEKTVFDTVEMVCKVKEIMPSEFGLLKEDQILFTYIHSSNRLPETNELLGSKCVAFAMEDMKDSKGRFPLLEPMSKIAGEMGLLNAIFCSMTTKGGLGVSVTGTIGVKPMKIVIFGAGHVGVSAAKLAMGMNADVVLMDVDLFKLEDVLLNKLPKVRTEFSNEENVRKEIRDADIVMNCTKWFPGLRIMTREMLKEMKPNAVIVDVDAEPNATIETSEFTTHDEPVKVVDGIRHICIPNLPSSCAYTSSCALSNSSIKAIAEIADKGWKKACQDNQMIEYGLDFVKGYLTFVDTARAFNLELTDKKWVYENL